MGDTKQNPSLPGKAPARADSELNSTELERRNRRRARNREAATRQRKKREYRVELLENEIEKLKCDRGTLQKQNQAVVVKAEYDGECPVYSIQDELDIKRTKSSGEMEEIIKILS